MTRAAVLIPTGIEMKSYGCIRSLNKHGIRTVVASDAGRVPQLSSRYCDETHHIPSHKRDLLAYKDALVELAARPDVQTVIPVRECDVYVLAAYREEFTPHVSLVTPTLDVLRTGHDRLQLAAAAERADVPVAETRLLSSVETIDRDSVVKSRYNILTSEYVEGYGEGDVDEINDVRFFEAGDSLDRPALRETMGHDPIVQAFIPEAKKHLYCGLWVDGEPLSTYQHEQHRKVSWVGGGGVYRTSVFSPAVEEAADALLSELNWTGYACIEYIKDSETGEWKFLELNPRVWHSLPEAVRAGVDFPYQYWACSQGHDGRFDDSYETGIACHTSYGELKHLLSVLSDDSPFLDRPSFARTLWEITRSCVAEPRFDFIRKDDPRFFLSAVGQLSGISFGHKYASRTEPTESASKTSPATQPERR